jgi:hypothetical protein
MAYSKSKAAASLGISGDELKNRAKKAGFKDTEAYYTSIGGASAPLIESISKQMVEYDRQIEELTPYLSLTDEEKQAFLDKAIEQITPYYDNKKKELEASLQEGKVRTAEDILTNIKKIDEETRVQLENFDLSKAETEEDFLNKIGELTTNKGQDIAAKTEDYRQRMENLKANQIQGGTLTSGIGAAKRAEQDKLKAMELTDLENQYSQTQTATETAKKYTIDQIALARRSAEEARVRAIGGVTEAGLTQEAAQSTLGINDLSQLKSPEEMARQRAERATNPLYDKTALTDLEGERLKARESTAQELQANELAVRNQTYGLQRDKILAERAKKAAQITALRGY